MRYICSFKLMESNKKKYVIYKCKDCNKSFGNQKTTYKQHILDNHSSYKERKKGFAYYCKYCDMGTFSSNTWELHLSRKKHIKMKILYKERNK